VKEERALEEGSIDAPLENPEFDCLDRAIFAQRIFKIIEGTPKVSNLTIGILGSWGFGKTTTMNFLKFYCRQAGHSVASYNPWQFHSREDAWKGFVSSIDKGIAIWQGKKLPSLKRQAIVKKVSEKFRDVTAITEVGKIAGTLILQPLEGLLKQTKQKVQKELDKALKDKRLFVFIDDLDRAEPDILYDHLMLLNEVVDLKRCVYIIGLDIDTASRVIQHKIGFTNLTDKRDFFNKIISWQFNLPQPTDFDWYELLDKEVEKLNKNLKKDALISIFPYLPKNPRRFKHFLRYLSALHQSFLDRFDDSELNWKVLYMAQLIRIEFPEIFIKLISTKEILEDISSGLLTDSIARDSRGKQKDEIPNWRKNIQEITKDYDENRKVRFTDLYRGLRESGGFILPEQLQNHLLVVEVPELFTWKEYTEFKNDLLLADNNKAVKKLSDFLKQEIKGKHIERVREFLKMLIRDRHALLSQAADSIDQEEEMKPLIDKAKGVMKICSIMLDIDDIFKGHNPVFNAEVFKEWYGNLLKWAHFRHPKNIYSDIRQLEADLAIKLAHKVESQASLIFETFRFDTSFDSKKDFELTHNKVKEILEMALVEQIIDRFKRIDGIKELYGQKDRSFRLEKSLLFRKNPIFHNNPVYAQLRDIAQDAPNDPNIRNNFYEFVSMLFYAATDYLDWTEKDEVIKLLKEKEFMDIVWGAVVSRRLNLRSVGSLEGKRKKIIEIIEDADAFPVPKWWNEMLSEVKDRI